MSHEETCAQIRMVGEALAEGARRLEADQLVKSTSTGETNTEINELADRMEGIARVMVATTTDFNQGDVPAMLRAAAFHLERWAKAPGQGLTVTVAVLRMAADHAEQGATMTTAEIIVANINEYVASLVNFS